MSLPHINFIGCGRLGKTLGALFHAQRVATIGGIICGSYESAVEAVAFIGQGAAYHKSRELPPADIYIIATKDDVIETACNELVSENEFLDGKIIIHCSGSLTSDSLSKARERNCHIASVHPLKSFANPSESVKSFSGTYCGLEGDRDILIILQTLFENIGAKVRCIKKERKKVYHAASVLANNYLVTLHYQALQAFKEAGVDDEAANDIITLLMSDAFKNLKASGHARALTGPIQRGDVNTVQGHLAALSELPLIQEIYAALGKATLPITQHSADKRAALEAALTVYHPEDSEQCHG